MEVTAKVAYSERVGGVWIDKRYLLRGTAVEHYDYAEGWQPSSENWGTILAREIAAHRAWYEYSRAEIAHLRYELERARSAQEKAETANGEYSLILRRYAQRGWVG
jgi:hypothetical protein